LPASLLGFVVVWGWCGARGAGRRSGRSWYGGSANQIAGSAGLGGLSYGSKTSSMLCRDSGESWTMHGPRAGLDQFLLPLPCLIREANRMFLHAVVHSTGEDSVELLVVNHARELGFPRRLIRE
jgi:hypothetical protein